jgi:peptide/nickel transport system permease protein
VTQLSNNASAADSGLLLEESQPAASGSLASGEGMLRRVLGNARFRTGLGLVIVILLLALIGPLFAPHSPTALIGKPFAGPNGNTVLGTDVLGRDVLSRVLNGGRSVVWMSVSAATLGMLAGVMVGLVAAYSPGWADGLIMRGMDVLYAFPTVVMALLVVSVLGAKVWLIVLVVAVVWVPQVARVTRGAALEVVGRQFVESAEVLGVPRRRILAGEVLPNISSPLLVEYGQRLTWSIATIATLSFLGVGVQAPASDWGLMINENRIGLTQQPLAVIVPAACIAIFAVGANLMAEGVSRVVGGTARERGAGQ